MAPYTWQLCCVLVLSWSAAALGTTADGACLASVSLRARNNESFCSNFTSFASAVLGCAGITDDPLRPLRLLAPQQVATILPKFVEVFTQQTGFRVLVDYVPLEKISDFMLDPMTYGKQVYDGWYADPVAVVDLAYQGMIEPLDSYIAADPTSDWPDISRFFRLTSATYNGSVVGYPAAGKISTLYYRKDVFAAAGIPGPPNTWDEFVAVARALNGSDFDQDGQGDYSVCLMIWDGCLEVASIFGQLLAPMMQTRGLQSGWLFDPDTMRPLVDSEATYKALATLSAILPYLNPDRTCQTFQMRFLTGKCAMTIKWDEHFKAMQFFDKIAGLPYNPWKGGTVGYAQLPGSSEVLDRNTGKLIPCSDTTVCPYATKVTSLITGQPVLVNRAPYTAISGINTMVNAQAPKAYKQAMYNLGAMAGSFAASMELVVALTVAGPFRDRHIATDNASLAVWAAAGYDTNDVKTFLTNMKTSLNNPNIAMDARFTNSVGYRNIHQQAIAKILSGEAPKDVYDFVVSGVLRIFNNTNQQQFWTSYWAALNLKRTYPLPPAPIPSATPIADTQPRLSQGAIIAIVVAAVAVCVAVALTSVLVWKKSALHGWRLFGINPAPGVGECTTLLVTDIENSTLLWESVPQDAMDQALTLHHTLVRSLLAKHHGYESCTEGDSFIVAFHSPGSAVMFAEDLQLSLLQQEWPQELLDSPHAAAVWATAAAPKPSAGKLASVLDEPIVKRLHTIISTAATASLTSEPASRERPESARISTDHTPPRDRASHGPQHRSALQTATVGQASATDQPVDSEDILLGKEGCGELSKDLPSVPLRFQAASSVPAQAAASFLGSLIRSTSGRMKEEPGLDVSASAQPALAFMRAQWRLCSPPSDPKCPGSAVLVFRGLRVRAGMHSGIHDQADAVMNKTTNRIAYGGQPLMLAKATADAAAGGQIILTQSSFEQLSPQEIKNMGQLLNLGDFLFSKSSSLPVTTLFQVVPQPLDSRLLFFNPSLRFTTLVQAGVLDAPVGQVAICFVNMVGASTLQAWHRELAAEAMDSFAELVHELLLQHPAPGKRKALTSSSYLVELAGGFCLAAFSSPAAALTWSTALATEMRQQAWSEELLSHELCEPVVVGMGAGLQEPGRGVAKLLFCGPRLKIGIDTGQVHAAINPVTGRMAYRGRVMNRTARIAEKAGAGQVWCSENTWDSAQKVASMELARHGVVAQQLGTFHLKGVASAMTLMHVTTAAMSRGHDAPALDARPQLHSIDPALTNPFVQTVFSYGKDEPLMAFNPLAVERSCKSKVSFLERPAVLGSPSHTAGVNHAIHRGVSTVSSTARLPDDCDSASGPVQRSSTFRSSAGDPYVHSHTQGTHTSEPAAVYVLGARVSVHMDAVDLASGNLSRQQSRAAETAYPAEEPSSRISIDERVRKYVRQRRWSSVGPGLDAAPPPAQVPSTSRHQRTESKGSSALSVRYSTLLHSMQSVGEESVPPSPPTKRTPSTVRALMLDAGLAELRANSSGWMQPFWSRSQQFRLPSATPSLQPGSGAAITERPLPDDDPGYDGDELATFNGLRVNSSVFKGT